MGGGFDRTFQEMKKLGNVNTVGRILVGWDPVSFPCLLGACGNSLSLAPDRAQTCNSQSVVYDLLGVRMSNEGELIGPV